MEQSGRVAAVLGKIEIYSKLGKKEYVDIHNPHIATRIEFII